MSTPVSFLVSLRRKRMSLSVWRVCALWSILAYSCLCGSRTVWADSQALDAEISTLGKSVDETTTDVNAAFEKFKQETNLSQSVLIVGGILTAHPGDTIQWPISLVPGTFSPTALQFDLTIPTGLTFVSAAIGPAGVLAGKQFSSSVVGGTPRALLFGINQTPIGSGVVAIITLKVDPAAAKRNYPVALSNPAVSDGAGNAVVNSTVSGTVIVQ